MNGLKRIILILIFIFCFSYSFSQINVGAYVGLNSSSFTGDKPSYIGYGFKNGLIIGALGEFKIAPDVWLSLQPAYFLGGGNILERDTIDTEIVYEYPVNTQVITLPIIFKIYATNRFYFTGGVQVSYLLTSSFTYREEEIDLDDLFDRGGVSMSFGIGYTIPFNRSSLGIDLQFVQILNNITDNAYEDQFLERVRVSQTRLTVQYMFNLGKKDE